MRCPSCTDAHLDKYGSCHRCHGMWLQEQLVGERTARPLVYTGGRYSERHCPVCDETMDEPLVFDVPVDRCEQHGMWFDKAELELVIERSTTEGWRSQPATRPEDSLRMLVAAVGAWRATST